MSRASLTADVMSPRTSRNQTSNDDDDGNNPKTTFPRRFPRLGNAFQLKGLPDQTASYVPERPSPLFLSENAPWRTHEEVQHSQKQQQEDNSKVSSGATKEANGSALKSSSWLLSSTSGSLGSSKVQWGYEQNSGEAFTAPVPLVLATRPGMAVQQQPNNVMQDWLQQIVMWHATKLSLEDSAGRQQQRRKAKKRSHSDQNDEQLPPLPKRAATVSAASTTVLQYHWIGERARAGKQAVSDGVSDWRKPSVIAISGDFRDSHHTYVTPLPDETADSNAVGLHQGGDLDTMWNAVLACAQTLEEKLLACSSKIYVSQLVTVLECARRLPSPEHVFNGTDGGHMIEAIDATLNHLNGVVQNARSCQAHMLDKLYSKREDIIKEGVDVEAVKDLIQQASEAMAPVVFDEKDQWVEQIDQIIKWQTRVDNTDTSSRDQLQLLQQLAAEAATQHCFISQFVVQLVAKLQRADELMERIESWRQEQRTESVKWVTNLVRDVERLQIQLPASKYLLQVHADMIAWVERADVAIRSRLSLQQVQDLLDTTVPGVELTDRYEKLQSRVASADAWLAALRQLVPDPNPSLVWTNLVRQELQNGDIAIDLHDLSCEGGRLPVQVPEAQLLQVEVEARSWTSQALKWVPAESSSSSSSKRPKLDELKEHMAKTDVLKDLLVALPNEEERRAWVLPGEDSLKKLVEQAEQWLETFHSVGQEEGKYLSLNDLRAIEKNGQAICVNLTPATAQVKQVLTQADAWFNEYAHLWTRCYSNHSRATDPVEVTELKAAVNAAESSLQIDLQEAVDLEKVLTRIEEWQNSVNLATGKVSRRHKRLSLTADDLKRLLKEAPLLPIDTNEHVENLLNELDMVSAWQTQASARLGEVESGLQRVRQVLNMIYGPPRMYTRLGQSGSGELAKGAEAAEVTDKSCSSISSSPSFSLLWNVDPGVQGIIDMFCASTETIYVDTPESDFSTVLSAAAKWCSRSVKYLESQIDVFDKRFFGAFDRFILEGEGLKIGSDDNMEVVDGENPKCTESSELQQLKKTMGSLVGDQMQRLAIILTDRERYIRWCSVAKSLVFAGDKKPSLERLKQLSMESQCFPGASDPVRKIRKLADDASDWALRAREAMATETRMSYTEAKSLCSEGENLGFQCDELAQLRRGLKAARSWANRAKRSTADQGSILAKDLQDLIDDHDMLLVSLPEEMSKLRQAARKYCICRRPYEGFMIECESCGDWFHGPCIGVSEARADKVDKYMCVRCCLARTYRSSADVVAGIIRKWTSEKELKKARQIAAQKHQRKVRKELKAISKLREEESALLQEKAALELFCARDVECEQISEKVDVSNEISEKVDVSNDRLDPSAAAQPVEMKYPVALSISESTVMPGVESNQSPEVVPSSELTLSATNPSVRKSAISSRLCRIAEDIQLCEDSLLELDTVLKEKERAEDLKDRYSSVLRKWCIRVRSRVLVPFSSEQAQICRPNADGSISGAMKSVLEEADQRGLSIFEDVRCVSNAFSCMGWALRATTIVGKQPHVDEVESLVQQASLLTLPDEKGLRMLKGITQRARSWNKKVTRTLIPTPGESRPFNLEYLRDLATIGDDIPVYLPLESRLHTVIEDKGARHCLCGGPSDGRFMLGCDTCEKWFHGHCVGINSRHPPEDLEEWKCPHCTNIVISDVNLDLERFHDKFDVAFESCGEDDDISCSSRAPKPDEMWPPFGLKISSAKAVEALGSSCCAMPDSDGDWIPEVHALGSISVDAPDARGNQVNIQICVNSEAPNAKTNGEATSEFADSLSINLISESSSSSARSMESLTDLPDTVSERGGTATQP